jgi:hypothetical protein
VKMGPIRCPETSVNNYHTTQRNIPEDCGFHGKGIFRFHKLWEIDLLAQELFASQDGLCLTDFVSSNADINTLRTPYYKTYRFQSCRLYSSFGKPWLPHTACHNRSVFGLRQTAYGLMCFTRRAVCKPVRKFCMELM